MAKDSIEDDWAKVTKLAASGKLDGLASSGKKTRVIDAAGIRLEYSRAAANDEILLELEKLAASCMVKDKFFSMHKGDKVNFTEKRAAGHMRLRDPEATQEILDEMERMLAFANALNDGNITGATGKKISSILHIGIGGSCLGPRLVCESLPNTGPRCRFVANVDPAAITDAIDGLDPAATFVVSASKSGTTTETLENTKLAMDWIESALGKGAGKQHVAVVSANNKAGESMGCPKDRCFAMWDWVGGRYSLWSPVGMSAAACVGTGSFRQMLAGAHDMDGHVLETEGFENLPVAMALLRAWHAIFLGAQSHCVVAYQHRLRSLPAYLQQLVMESNGKSADKKGKRPQVATSAIWWGGEGTTDQHSYFQLLLQGMRPVSADFIFARKPRDGESKRLHCQLLAHCIGQSMALHRGISFDDCVTSLVGSGVEEKRARLLAVHMAVPGKQPTNLLSFERLGPATLGSLVAAYEHMTAALGWMWGINSFDQWGVELGKSNFRKVLQAMEGKKADGKIDSIAKGTIGRLEN